MTARDALRLGTRGGAAVLRRDDIGSLEPGKRADLAIWRTDGLEFGGADDSRRRTSCSSGPHRVDRLLVGGQEVVRDGALVQADEQEIAREHRKEARRLWQMTVSTHVLDTERGRPAAGVRVELYGADGSLAGAGVTDDDGRIARPRRDRRRHLPDRLPPAVAVLPARRARGRARRGPPPRPAPDLVVRMRELPRQLTAEQLAELFEGRTRFVERLAALEDPLGQARDGRARAVRRRAEGAARRAPGDRRQGDLRRAPPPSRAATTTRPCSPSSRS